MNNYEERIDNIKTLTEGLLQDMKAELKRKAEEKGEPIYGGIYDAEDYFHEMMSWFEGISDELEQS